MSNKISEYLTKYQQSLNKVIISYAIRPSTFWTLCADSSLVIFQRNNPSIFSRYQFDVHDPKKAKMVVDNQGDRCILFWERLPVLMFSVYNPIFIEVPIVKTFSPLCACWISESYENISFILGTNNGEVLNIFYDETYQTSILFVLPDPSPIYEIHLYLSEIKIVFVFLEDKILSFSGRQSLELIFGNGPSNRVLFIGKSPSSSINRAYTDSCKGMCRLSASHELGIISFTANDCSNDQVRFSQDISEIDIHQMSCFIVFSLGTLVALEKNLILMYKSKPKASIPISGVKFMSFDSNGLVFFTDSEIITMPLLKIKEYLVHLFLKQKDFPFALFIAGNDEMKYQVVREQMEKLPLSSIGSFLLNLNWTFHEISEFIGLKNYHFLLYLKALVKKLGEDKCRLRITLLNFIFHIHISLYPQYDSEFLGFIAEYFHSFQLEWTIKQFNEIGFVRGVESITELNKSTEECVNYYLSNNMIDKALELLPSILNSKKLNGLLIRVLRSDTSKVSKFVIQNKFNISLDTISSVLVHIPDCAAQIISGATIPISMAALSIWSFCLFKNEQSIITLLKRGVNPSFLFRYCIHYDCFEAASQVLLWMKFPKNAVRIAHRVSYSYAHHLVETISDSKLQKEGWIQLIQLSIGEQRENLVKHLIKTSVFEFVELIDCINDDEPFYTFSEQMLNAVRSIESYQKETSFVTSFPPPKSSSYVVESKDACQLCGKTVLGCDFIRFPCSHMIHNSCIKTELESYKRKGDIYESCPICGFISVSSINNKVE